MRYDTLSKKRKIPGHLFIIVLGRQNVLVTKGLYENDYEGMVATHPRFIFYFTLLL